MWVAAWLGLLAIEVAFTVTATLVFLDMRSRRKLAAMAKDPQP